MNKDKELEEAINILNNKIYSLNENIKIYDKGYDLSIKNELVKEKEAIEIVLQSLEEVTEERDIYLRQLNKAFDNGFIPKKKIEDKKNKINEEYMSILSEYGNTDVDVIINVPNENVRKHLDKLVERVLVLQELLEDK